MEVEWALYLENYIMTQTVVLGVRILCQERPFVYLSGEKMVIGIVDTKLLEMVFC